MAAAATAAMATAALSLVRRMSHEASTACVLTSAFCLDSRDRPLLNSAPARFLPTPAPQPDPNQTLAGQGGRGNGGFGRTGAPPARGRPSQFDKAMQYFHGDGGGGGGPGRRGGPGGGGNEDHDEIGGDDGQPNLDGAFTNNGRMLVMINEKNSHSHNGNDGGNADSRRTNGNGQQGCQHHNDQRRTGGSHQNSSQGPTGAHSANLNFRRR